MVDVTDATFGTAVVERSNTVPVIVDLWAPWCGPCKQLGPILEKVVSETNGLVELAKVNVDENPSVSQAFQVQSIPAVYAMRDGQVVDGFMGAVGEPQVVAFVQRLLDAEEGAAPTDGGDESDADGTDAESSPSADPTAASTPGHVPGGGGALDLAASGEPRLVDAPGTGPAAAAAPPAPAPSAERAAEIERELERLLGSVKADDDARARYLELLDELGPQHPETGAWRRRLTTTLF